MGALENKVGQVLGGARGRTLKDAIAAQYREVFTDSGKPRGTYAAAISLVEKLEEEVGPKREELPDEPFLTVARDLQFSLDVVYFRAGGLPAPDALRLRTKLIERLQKTSQWRGHARNPGYGTPMHLDGALGTAFMSLPDFRQPPTCYVMALGMKRADVFIPALTELAERIPSLFTAKAVLSIVAVSPDYPFLAFGVKAIGACMRHAPNDTNIWIDYGVGADFCAWLAGVCKRDGLAGLEQAGVRDLAEQLLSDMIRLGVPEASALERDLAAVAPS